ncbi:uncharacterized protein HD556DRAFT_1446692 [Suillus plorans]|uniref:Uncharacterized protein n=1 Tax=Suillus plorans TaxID=116603 RepID=A0A9P7AJN3_9AGAM|nr:uncharacterized protein HD556DRAFT_1446692 [Suillus plorans]KAG1789904.1 hypothetical protein HD556DRAFT_1446692 [Suillus plorans]
MSVDDTNTQCPRIGPEDVQTSHDAELFDDNDNDNDNGCESGTGNFLDALSQPSASEARPSTSEARPSTSEARPSTSAVRLEKRVRNELASENVAFQEERINKIMEEGRMAHQQVEERLQEQEHHAEVVRQQAEKYIQEQHRLAEVARQQAEERIQEQSRLAEEEHKCHAHDIGKKAQQLEAALRERENQLNHDKNELEVIRQQRQQQYQEAVELTERKQKELEEREKVIGAEVERRLQLEVETLKAAKKAELANMEQRFARRGRQRDTAMDMDADTTPMSAQQQAKTPQKPHSNTPSLDAIKRIKRARGTTRRTRLVSVADDDDPIETRQE